MARTADLTLAMKNSSTVNGIADDFVRGYVAEFFALAGKK